MMSVNKMVASKMGFNMLNRLVLAFLSLTLLSMAPLQGFAEEDEDDEELSFTFEEKVASCAACHGENGDQPLAPEYPILAGQYPDYIAQALRQYRDGQRTNPIMAQQVEILELTDADMVKLGKHFAAKPGVYNLTK